MSSINSISGSGFSMMTSGTKRPDPSKMVDDLFSKLDTTGKGYLTKSDLQSAATQSSGSDSSNSSGSTSSSTNVDELFKKLDTNGDGKITKEELTSGMKQLADALGPQNGTSGGGKAAGGTAPSGSGNANSTSSTNGTSSTQSSSTSKTYDPADTNQDGTVSAQERIAYALKQLASQLNESASSTSSNSTSSTSTSSDAKIFKQITDIMRVYGSSDSGSNNSGLSVTA